jgi:hypothetical protein
MADGGPVNYDHVTIGVGPNDLKWAFEQMKIHSEAIAESLERIMLALNGLSVEWRGDSEKEAEHFNTRWAEVTAALFGARGGHSGVLNAMIVGLGTAYGNYQKAELGLEAVWATFRQKVPLDGSGDPPSDDPPPDKTINNDTANKADYPPLRDK